MIDFETNGAWIEDDFRYLLWRRWEPGAGWLKWIMLNPSTADATSDDATIRKCVKFAKRWGYGGIKVVNLFAWRATDPRELKKIGYGKAVGPKNNVFIDSTLNTPGQNIAAWGQGGKLYGRAAAVRWYLDQRKTPLYALKLSKDGTPYHPLYLRDDSLPFAIR